MECFTSIPVARGPRRFRAGGDRRAAIVKGRQGFHGDRRDCAGISLAELGSAGRQRRSALRARSAHACGAGGAGACPPPVLTRSFNSLLGLKNGIFWPGQLSRSPVLGLRPTRGLRWRVRKLPKPRISILSPTRSERTMLSKIVSTMTSLSLRVNSASSRDFVDQIRLCHTLLGPL